MKRGSTAFCYRLGLLQALAHAPAFCTALEASREFCKVKDNQNKCLTCALHGVIRSYWHAPDALDKAVKKFNEVLCITAQPSPWYYPSASEQADIQEFWGWLHAVILEQHTHDSDLEATTNIVLEGRWTCSHCRRVHIKSDQDMCLSLGITEPKPDLTLSRYLGQYLTEDLEIRCDNPRCKSNEERERGKRFTTLPSVLFIQLKLFEWTGGRLRKVKSKPKVPSTLSLKDFVKEGMEGTRYELAALVAHSGDLNSGHYISVVNGPAGIYEINDERVRGMESWKDLSRGFSPYLLVYVRSQVEKLSS